MEADIGQHVGRVCWFNNDLRMGFLSREDGPYVLCRASAIQGTAYQTLIQGETVEYDIAQGLSGPVASNVQRLQGWQATRRRAYLVDPIS